MLFFMSKKNFERYVAQSCNEIVEYHKLKNIPSVFDKIQKNIVILQNEVKRISSQGYSMEELEPVIKSYIEGVKSDLKKEADGNIENNKTAIKAELSSYISQTVNSGFGNIQQELAVRDSEIQRLEAVISEERRRNSDLIRQLQIQNEKIQNLFLFIEEMKRETERLSKRNSSVEIKVPKPESVSVPKPEPVSVPKLEPVTLPQPLCIFGENSFKNIKTVENFVKQTKKLRVQIESEFADSESFEIYLKLVDKCIRKFEALAGKCEERRYEADKTANETAKILKQTIVRAMSQRKLRQLLDKYMKWCNVRKLDWEVGKIMDDDDYAYLEEPVLYDEVPNPKLNNTITEIRQDTYIIDYIEDGIQQEAVIPGIYSIGKYHD